MIHRFTILDDDGFAIRRLDGTRQDAERIACGRTIIESKAPRKPTRREAYSAALKEAGRAPF